MSTPLFGNRERSAPRPASAARGFDERGSLRRGSTIAGMPALLLSTLIFEVSGNILYVMLMERSFELGRGAFSVGLFLILQAAAQLLLGSFIGSFVDALGGRRATLFGLGAHASLALGLSRVDSIEAIYLFALLLTVSRLYIITARMPLVSRFSTRSRYLPANTALSVLTGLGLFVGPALAAMLVMLWKDPSMPFLTASGLFILGMLPLLPRRAPTIWSNGTLAQRSVKEIRSGWKYIAEHRPIWEALLCLSISSISFGAIMPTLTLLARRAGFGMEGSGVFVAALGLGWTFGPLATDALLRRLGFTNALLLTGLATPAAVLSLGLLPSLAANLGALVAAALAGASLQVIVVLVIQRLTPPGMQGSVTGAQQALSALVWIISASTATGVLSLIPSTADPRGLFYPVGVIGIVMMLACWAYHKGSLRALLGSLRPDGL